VPGQAVDVTLKGRPVTLIGDSIIVGQKAPHFVVCDHDLMSVPFCSLGRGPFVISSVISLDTEVCDREARRFNKEAAALDPDLGIIVISMDLPFAQKRWCGAAGIDQVHVYSDHRDASFGTSYGVLIRDLRLLARACFVVDVRGIICHKEIVSEVTDEPDYEALFEAVRQLAGGARRA